MKQAPATLQSTPLLARIAGRGAIVHRWAATTTDHGRLLAWQRALLSELALDEGSYPSAAVTAVGIGLEVGSNAWLHAEAVHFAAGMNEVTLVPLLGDLALTAEEYAQMTPILTEHLAASRLRIYSTLEKTWLLELPPDWNVHTVAPDFAIQHDWNEALPRGDHAGGLRRLMTELQMLLHDHPVNQRRNARGIPTANAVWFWGDGRVSRGAVPPEIACFGRSDYLKGLCRLHGWPIATETSVEAISACARESRRAVCVVDVHDLEELESRWLAPLMTDLQRGHFIRIDVVLDEWQLTIDRWRLKRFWRRDRSVSEWASA